MRPAIEALTVRIRHRALTIDDEINKMFVNDNIPERFYVLQNSKHFREAMLSRLTQ